MMQHSIFQNDSELRSCLLSLSLKWLYIKIKLSEFFTFCTSQCIYPLSFGDFFCAAEVCFLFCENSDVSFCSWKDRLMNCLHG